MSLRSPVPEGLKPVCELLIPATAKSVSIRSQALILPRMNPLRIVVVGDTGCRIKGDRVQDCNDPSKWPLQRVARRAAAEKPDLIIHVGDYLYREDRCPEDLKHLCGATPAGDRWETWEADFFGPSAKLLAAAPWAFSRGNHEDCARAWKGWFYYLDPRPWTNRGCVPYSAPYLVTLGNLQLFMLDSSAAIEKNPSEKQVATYTAQLRSIRGGNVWIIDHHPFWGMKANTGAGRPDPLTTPLAEAWERAAPQGVSMVISGHTHLFELLSFDRKLPPQLIAGDGGTALAPAPPATVNGAVIRGASVVSATSRREFGYTVMTKAGNGWDLALKDPVDGIVVTCSIQGIRASCEPGKKTLSK